MVRLTCVMEGFEGNRTSKPKWTTNFEDHQISKDEDGTSWIDEGYAGWEVNVTVSNKDFGSKVRFPLIKVVLTVCNIFRKSLAIINRDILPKSLRLSLIFTQSEVSV